MQVLKLESTDVEENCIQNSSEKNQAFFLYEKKIEISKHNSPNFCYLAFLPMHWSTSTFL